MPAVKRALAGLLALSMVLLTPPPAAWSALAEVVVPAAPAGVPAAAAGASAAVPPALPLSTLAPSFRTSAFAPSAAVLSAPSALPPANAVEAAAAAAPAAAAVEAAAPARIAAARSAPARARAGLLRTARTLSAPRADAAPALDALFEGARRGAAASDTPAPDPVSSPESRSRAAGAGLDRAAAPAPGGPADRAAPVAAPAPKPAPATRGGRLLHAVAERVARAFRVLPEPERNRAFWIYTLGNALSTLGANFHYTALPNLVAPSKADTKLIGYNRAANWGAQAASNLTTGPLVDRRPVKETLVWTYLGRAGLTALVPVLFAAGHLGFAAFTLIIALTGFLQATTITAGSVAFNRILGPDETYYNRANAVATIVIDAVGVIGPLLAGGFIAWAGTLFAPALMGSALAYGVYAAFLLGAGLLYARRLSLPHDAVQDARDGLRDALRTAGLGPVQARGVTIEREDGKPVLLVEVSGDPARAEGLPAEFRGISVRAVPRRSPVRELAQGFKLALSSRFLRLYMILTTVSAASGDSLIFTVLPRYLTDILHAGPGAFGLFLAVTALGTGVASILVTLIKDPALAALSPAAGKLRAALAARDPWADASRLDRAAAAVRASLPAVLERYKVEWRAGTGSRRGPEALSADLLAEASARLAGVLGATREAASAALESSGAADAVRLWAGRKGAKFAAGARQDAETGMDSLQRQGRWSNWLHTGSWVAYGAVFFAHALWPSAGFMFVSALLAGSANVVWASLTTRMIAGRFPNDQGKVYSAMTFYWLACSVLGVLVFGWLMSSVATGTALWITAGVLAVCAVLDVAQTLTMFPADRRARR
jgi:hypothetical protein